MRGWTIARGLTGYKCSKKGDGENRGELYLMSRKGDKYGRRREKDKMTVRVAEKVVRSHAVHLPKNTYSIY